MRGPKSLSIWLRQPERLQGRDPLGDEGLPAFGGVAAAIDVDHAALGGGALGDAHLVEAVLAQDGQRGGFRLAVAADEARRGRRLAGALDPHELALVVGRHEHAVIVEIDVSASMRCMRPKSSGHSMLRSRSTGVERALEDDGLRLRDDRRGRGGGRPAAATRAAEEAPLWRRTGGGGRHRARGGGCRPGDEAPAPRRLAQPDPADRAGGAVDIPGAGLAEDDGGFGRQVGRHVGLEGALLAEA